MSPKKIELLELQGFEKIVGGICLVMVFQRDATVGPITVEDDLKKILENMLKKRNDGTYPFIAINLGPIAYGKVKLVSDDASSDASLNSPSSS